MEEPSKVTYFSLLLGAKLPPAPGDDIQVSGLEAPDPKRDEGSEL